MAIDDEGLFQNQVLYPSLENLLGVPIKNHSQDMLPFLNMNNYMSNDTLSYLPHMTKNLPFAFDADNPLQEHRQKEFEK